MQAVTHSKAMSKNNHNMASKKSKRKEMITQHKIAASVGTGVLGVDEYHLKLNSSKWSSLSIILHQ
jgi:hypothetical protein